MPVLEKILRIQQELVVPKSGYDERNEYYYYRAEDVATAVRNAMSEQGLIHRSEIVEWNEDNYYDPNGRNRPRLSAKVNVVFIDVSDGSEFSTQVLATGSDTGGDKAPRKAQVQAFKIAAVDVFIITEESGKFDSDSYPEAEPVATEAAAQNSEPTLADLNATVREMVGDPASGYTGEIVGKIGKRLAEKHGVDTQSSKWRKSENVMKDLVDAMRKGEVE